MSGRSDGFTFIEIVVVMMIIAILGAITIPRLFRKRGDPRKTFATQLNALTLSAWRGATETQTVHRIVFDFRKGEVRVERASRAGPLESYVTEQFVPTSTAWGKVRFDIDPQLVIRNVIIEGKDVVAGGDMNDCWFFIDPDEAAQETTIVIGEEKEIGNMTLVLNPFTKQFSEYEGVVKPA